MNKRNPNLRKILLSGLKLGMVRKGGLGSREMDEAGEDYLQEGLARDEDLERLLSHFPPDPDWKDPSVDLCQRAKEGLHGSRSTAFMGFEPEQVAKIIRDSIKSSALGARI